MTSMERIRQFTERFHSLAVEAMKEGYIVVFAIADESEKHLPLMDGNGYGHPLSTVMLAELLRDDLKVGLNHARENRNMIEESDRKRLMAEEV